MEGSRSDRGLNPSASLDSVTESERQSHSTSADSKPVPIELGRPHRSSSLDRPRYSPSLDQAIQQTSFPRSGDVCDLDIPWPKVNYQVTADGGLPEDRDASPDDDSATDVLDNHRSTPESESLIHFAPLMTEDISSIFTKHRCFSHRIFLTLNWEIFDYVRLEMRPGQYLGDMLVATGTQKNSWITRCRDYLKRSSPIAGGPILHLMESITSLEHSTKLDERIEKEIKCNANIGLVVYERQDGMSYMSASGPDYILTDIINAMLWFTATFRPFLDSSDSDVLMSKASVTLSAGERGIFGTISTNPLIAARGGLCWTRIYRGICASGFPIPPCRYFDGADIPFDVMLALAGVNEEVYQDGVASLRGYDHALYPVAVAKDGHTTLWHTSSCEELDDRYATLAGGAEECSDPDPPTLLEDHSRKKRHILGYAEKGKISLGTSDYQLQFPNRRSGSSVQKNRLCFRRKANINFGTSGLGMVGAGITLELGLTRSQAVRLDPVPNLCRQIHSAASRPLILYDLTGHVAYLVPETSAILHIALSWFSNIASSLVEGEMSKLPRAQLSSDGGSAARDCIIAACEQDLVLRGIHGDKWRFIDAIQDTLAALRSCRGLSTPTEYSKSIWERFHRKEALLYGWDLADYIANEETMYRQEVCVKMAAADSWVTHIARHPKMLVVFTKDLQPPIVLDQPDRVCRMWNPLPSAEFLLCSSQCISDLMQTCGGDPASARLTSQECYLHRQETVQPFRDCTFDGRSRCSKIHMLRSEPPKKVGQLPPEGAVLFGSSTGLKDTICQPRQEGLQTVSAKTFSSGCDAVLA